MGSAAGDILGEERLVEVDRGVDLLHDGVRLFGKPAAPQFATHGPSRGAAQMPEGQKRFVWNARVGAAVAAVAAVVLAGIYVTLAGQGNGGVAAECAAAKAAGRGARPAGRRRGGGLSASRDEPEKLSELAFTGADGKPMTLAAFKGKVALVNLWATWCGPAGRRCRRSTGCRRRSAATILPSCRSRSTSAIRSGRRRSSSRSG